MRATLKSTMVIKTRDIISDISFDDDHIIVLLKNGVKICTPLKYFPRLMNANPDQRNRWKLIGKGIGIHWEDIDEDISIETLIRYGNELKSVKNLIKSQNTVILE